MATIRSELARRGRRLGLAGLFAAYAALAPDRAAAQGLLGGFGPSGEAALAPLDQLTISAELGDGGASILESRLYAVPVSGDQIVFYRPLAPGSTIAVTVNQTPLAGSVLEGDEADRVRQSLVLSLREPAPLRDLGYSLFVSEPVTLPAGATEIVVTTELPLSNRGTLRGTSVPLDWHPADVRVVDIAVHAESDEPLRALYAPYHELSVTRDGEHQATGSYRGTAVCSRFAADLLYSSGAGAIGLDLLPFRYGDVDEGFFLALLTPSAATEQEQTIGRDLVLALDVSGSMAGEKIEQAKAALRSVVAGLRDEDRLGLVSFSSGVTAFANEAVPATQTARTELGSFVDGLVAAGGTNISGALERSYALLPEDAGRPRYVILLTDGQPTEGITDVDGIVELSRALNDGKTRVFSFGIGYDVNTTLLGKLTSDSGGDTLYVRPGDSVSVAVEGFFARISAPALTSPQLGAEGIEMSALYPAKMPDLFAGRTVAVLGRYEGGSSGVITISGSQGSTPTRFEYDVTLPDYAFDNGFVPRVWALRRVGELLDALKLGEASESAVDDLLAVARRYGVVTAFTYFVPNADGNLEMTYLGVPEATTGAEAVEAATSIGGYSQSSGAGSSVTSAVRYFQDRNFPTWDGYPTDSTLDRESDPTDVHFGSELYFELAATESNLGAHGFLSTAPELRFELFGRSFRVTDPLREDTDSVPDESESIPPAADVPSAGPTLSVGPPRTEHGAPSGSAGTQGLEPDTERASGQRTTKGGYFGCTASPGGGSRHGALLLLVLVVFAAVGRRSRAPHSFD